MLAKVGLILLGLLLLLGVAAAAYCYNNIHYDSGDLRRIARAGFTQKTAALPDGTTLAYGEGPQNGPPLLLLHGQMVDWTDYSAVLPTLAKDFHVYAVDCHGHGGSAKDPAKYTAAAMGADLVWFIQQVIGEPAVVSGHSSGGLLAAWLGANAPEAVLGLLLEDPPFFATEPGRAQHTFAGLGFAVIHNFLHQTEEENYLRYYLEHNYMQTFFGESWGGIKNYAFGYLKRHPGKGLRVFFLPPSLNRSFDLLTGPYDLRFGDAFYDFSWFAGFDQAETLSRIRCPAVLIHTNWHYGEDGVLLAAMDGEDAARAQGLIPGCHLVNIASGHNSHQEKPKEFLAAMALLRAQLTGQR